MGAHLTRVISDVHYADRGSRVRSLSQLRPLLEGVDELAINGDTLDTRPQRNGQHSTQARREVLEDVNLYGEMQIKKSESMKSKKEESLGREVCFREMQKKSQS